MINLKAAPILLYFLVINERISKVHLTISSSSLIISRSSRRLLRRESRERLVEIIVAKMLNYAK